MTKHEALNVFRFSVAVAFIVAGIEAMGEMNGKPIYDLVRLFPMVMFSTAAICLCTIRTK